MHWIRHRFFLFLAALVLVLGPGLCLVAYGNPSGSCESSFSRDSSASDLKDVVAAEALEQDVWASNKEAWEIYSSLAARRADVRNSLPRELVLELLADLESPLLSKNLVDVLKDVKARRVTVADALTKALRKSVPPAQVSARSVKLESIEALRRALGAMELSDVQELTFGSDKFSPSSESLIGKFIAETGADTRVTSFPRHPERGGKGPKRLVVAVSQKSFPAFKRFFSNPEWVSIIGHANMLYAGRFFSFGGQFQELRALDPNSVLPMVLLSTRESERLHLYTSLITKLLAQGIGWGGGNVAKAPWDLPGYVKSGGYNCCTHWWGNMPLGDKLVSEYRFPKLAKQDGGTGGAVVTKLRAYQHDDPLVKLIWSVPGHQQFADMLGQGPANQAGEFASPGYVMSSLLGPTTNERVPIVFYFTENHRQLPDKLTPHYEHPH